MPKKFRVFLDTSALIAGLNSPTGAAGTLLAASFSNEIIPVISPQVIEEMNRNVPAKFPKLYPAWASFLLIPPEITSEPALALVRKARMILPTSDAPILAAAIKAKTDVLVTWNTRDFMQPAVVRAVSFPILTPGKFLKKYFRKM